MNKEDIIHLSSLARIELSEKEQAAFAVEISDILEYVGTIQSIVDEDQDKLASPAVGIRHNVFRDDVATNLPDSYTEDILNEMPHRRGRFLEVKKILKTDTE